MEVKNMQTSEETLKKVLEAKKKNKEEYKNILQELKEFLPNIRDLLINHNIYDSENSGILQFPLYFPEPVKIYIDNHSEIRFLIIEYLTSQKFRILQFHTISDEDEGSYVAEILQYENPLDFFPNIYCDKKGVPEFLGNIGSSEINQILLNFPFISKELREKYYDLIKKHKAIIQKTNELMNWENNIKCTIKLNKKFESESKVDENE